MLTLYHNDMSVCAAKARTALAEKKLDWNGVHLDLRAGDAQKPEYLKLNPNAVVPTLVDNGRVIIELTVICEFIDDQWPDRPLKPTDAFGRAQMRLWTKQLDDGLPFLSVSPSVTNGSLVQRKIAQNGWPAYLSRSGDSVCNLR